MTDRPLDSVRVAYQLSMAEADIREWCRHVRMGRRDRQ